MRPATLRRESPGKRHDVSREPLRERGLAVIQEPPKSKSKPAVKKTDKRKGLDSAKIDRTKSVVRQVYQAVRRAILSNALRPGEPLTEQDLAERLDVSRTPAREALIWLARDGLVDIFPRHGTFVSSIRVEDIFEAHVIREALELTMVRQAAKRATSQDKYLLQHTFDDQRDALARSDHGKFDVLCDQFHAAIGGIAGLPRAWNLISDVKTHLDRVRRLCRLDRAEMEALISDYGSILRAIEANDADKAEKAVRSHLSRTFERIKAIIKTEQDYFALRSP